MAEWITGIQRRELGTFAASLGIGSVTAFAITPLDQYKTIRLLAGAPASSFSVSIQQGIASGTWLAIQSIAVASAASLDVGAMGRVGLVTITMGNSASMVRALVTGVPV